MTGVGSLTVPTALVDGPVIAGVVGVGTSSENVIGALHSPTSPEALAAHRARRFLTSAKAVRRVNQASGGALAGAGAVIAAS